ncbi:MAG: subtilase [Bdellovibrio sp. CG10_big_fil_rev_8_21_14_0_10_47_8]|nr:MAG: subtilase [Bdellovibrio sp. CG10_big_fil_rev_8_21_14_0_10_47_8]
MGILGRITGGAIVGSLFFGSISARAVNEPEFVPGEYVVSLKREIGQFNKQDLEVSLGSKIKETIFEDRIVVVQRSMIETAESAVKTLSENPLVRLAEPNYIYRINKTPNDPSFGKLWGLKNIGQSDVRAGGVAGVDINVEKAWDITTGSKDVLVAIIDTGIDYDHPDLKENIWTNQAEANGKPGVDDDNNGIIDDIHGANFVNPKAPTGNPKDDHMHGTHCAGTIGARGDDGLGIVGVNWNVRLMPVKFLGADGSGSLDGALKSIDYATKMGARIMSNSWGGGGESQTLKEAIQRANAAGALFVAAAGNDYSNNDTQPSYPASYNVPNVLAVAAIDNKGQLAAFSNYGKKSVHVAAPGVNVWSSVLNGKYASLSGTSMATPHVSGVAALLASADPSLTNLQLKERLIKTARPLASVREKVSSKGMVDAYAAITNQVLPPDPNDPDNWQFINVNISSLHPYESKSTEAFEVEVKGAKEIALFFAHFETEKNYDRVTVFDRAGNQIAQLSGVNDDTYSPTIPGDYAKIVLTSDDSVQKYGFDIFKVSYR